MRENDVTNHTTKKQQEPRMLTAFTQDDKLLDAYRNGKDMYATLGVGVYNNDYWDNMEHYQDGSKNEEGANRRKKMKKLYLGRPESYAQVKWCEPRLQSGVQKCANGRSEI